MENRKEDTNGPADDLYKDLLLRSLHDEPITPEEAVYMRDYATRESLQRATGDARRRLGTALNH